MCLILTISDKIIMNLVRGRVTVIIPCYNGSGFIKQCFSSVLEQTYKRLEVIFVDDGSTDDSFKEAKKWKQEFLNKGMQYICIKKENGGAASAVNKALSCMTGEYFEVFDVDDYIYPRNIESKIEYLKKHPEMMFVRNDGEIFNIQKDEIVSHFCTRDSEKRDYNIFEELLYGKTYNWTGTFLIRTQSFVTINRGLEIYNSRYGQNMQLLLPIAYYSECGFVPEILTRYNEYPNSISHDFKYDRNIKLLEGYQDIRIKVLTRLELTSDKQIEEINQFYLRKKMELAANFKNKKAVQLFYQQLTNKNWRDTLIYLRVKYRIIDSGFRKIVHLLNKG